MDKSVELGTGGVAEWILPFHDLYAGRMMQSSDGGIRRSRAPGIVHGGQL
jgi:hypothetical protein